MIGIVFIKTAESQSLHGFFFVIEYIDPLDKTPRNGVDGHRDRDNR